MPQEISYPPEYAPINDYASHLPLLWHCLNMTSGLVIELGSGVYSTSLLRDFCQKNGREFLSFDYNEDWAAKTGSIYVKDWSKTDLWLQKCGLVFIDESPAEHRRISLSVFKNLATVAVVHDSQESAEFAYGMGAAIKQYKYIRHVDFEGLPRTTAVSNFIQV